MRWSDELAAVCTFEAVCAHPFFVKAKDDFKDNHPVDYDVLLYCEAIAFLTSMHPGGRIAQWEDPLWAITESGLVSTDEGVLLSPDTVLEWIVYHVISNMVDEGTPMFIKRGAEGFPYDAEDADVPLFLDADDTVHAQPSMASFFITRAAFHELTPAQLFQYKQEQYANSLH